MHRWVAGFLAGLMLLSGGGRLRAQETADPNSQAAELAEQAAALYESGNREGAIDRFLEAMALVRDPAFAFNLAYIYDEIGVYPQAYRHYALYLRLYPMAPNAADVDARMTELEAMFRQDYAQLEVTSAPPGAEVWVSSGGRRESYGQTPVAEAWVAPGPLTVETELDGYHPVRREFNAVAGVLLDVNLGALARTEPEVTMTERRERPWVAPLGWTLIGLGVAAAGTGVVFWIQADGTADDYNSDVQRIAPDVEPPRTLQGFQDLAADAEDQALLGNVLFGVGMGLLATGTAVLLFVDPEEVAPASTASPNVLWFPGGAGLGFSSAF